MLPTIERPSAANGRRWTEPSRHFLTGFVNGVPGAMHIVLHDAEDETTAAASARARTLSEVDRSHNIAASGRTLHFLVRAHCDGFAR